MRNNPKLSHSETIPNPTDINHKQYYREFLIFNNTILINDLIINQSNTENILSNKEIEYFN